MAFLNLLWSLVECTHPARLPPFLVTHRPELMVSQVRGINHPKVSLKHEPNNTVSAHISDSDLKMLGFKS